MSSILLLIVLATSHGPVPADDSWSPHVPPTARFTSRTTAVVEWETRRRMKARVSLTPEGGKSRVIRGQSIDGRRHRVVLSGLVGMRPFTWSVLGTVNGRSVETSKEVLDPKFNYTVTPVGDVPDPWGDEAKRRKAAADARDLIEVAGTRSGHAVVVGAGDGRLMLELARATDLTVVGLESDRKRIGDVRRGLYQAGVHGHRVSVRQAAGPAAATMPRWFANLVVVHAESPKLTEADWRALWRLVRPDGGVLLVLGTGANEAERSRVTALTCTKMIAASASQSRVSGWRRPPVEGAGSWTHLYGQLDNRSNSDDALLGVRRSDEMEVQWLGRPGPDAMTDRNPRKPSPLATRGRTFTQGRKRIIAQDQYNGSILWTLEVPEMVRMNMPRDCGNWCASDDGLYVAIRDQLWRLDPATGTRTGLWRVDDDAKADDGLSWGFVGSLPSGRMLGSAVKSDAMFTNIFGRADQGWADATKGAVTRKVLSDCLFSLDIEGGKRTWTWRKGLVINPTITVAGDTVYFVETRHAGLKAAAPRAVESPELWTDLWMVALDARTGAVRWENAVKPIPGTVVFYLTHARDTLLMLTSGTRYELYAFDANDGKQRWHQGHTWPNNHHGRHMQHPVVVNDVVYVRPRGYAIADGKLMTDKLPDGGCGTISASRDAMMFRSGTIRMWDPETAKLTDWSRLRPGCWLSTITAGGMLIAPEAGGGCSCAGWFETSIGFLKGEPPVAAEGGK